MAVDRETLRLAGDLRIVLDEHVDQATRDLVAAWARTWQNLVIDWNRAYQPLIIANPLGTRPTRAQMLTAARSQEALATTRRALDDLASYAQLRILQPLDVIVAQAAAGQSNIIWSQMPEGDIANELRASVARVDQAQLEAIVARTTQQVTTLATALQPLGMEVVNNELVRGIALGLNPRKVAGDMVSAVGLLGDMQRAFNLPLTRAMVIARTEMLDAHRAGAGLTQAQHADVLAGWQWLAQLDTRTCPSCWSQHGSMHSLDESGPDDHQQGRCARLPVTKPWADLGFTDIIEPASLLADAEETFNGLPRADRLTIMGEIRLRRLEAGEVGWSELSVRRRNPGWRDSWVPSPARRVRRSRAA